MKDFQFGNEHSNSQIADITDLLRKPRLWIPTERDYPDHDAWLDKSESQLQSGDKRAMAARIGLDTVGAILYQRNPQLETSLEIRNISVSPESRGRYVAAFLLRNAEIEATQNDFPGIQEVTVDTKATNQEMITFLLSQGYTIAEITDLYGKDTGLDVVLTKSLA